MIKIMPVAALAAMIAAGLNIFSRRKNGKWLKIVPLL